MKATFLIGLCLLFATVVVSEEKLSRLWAYHRHEGEELDQPVLDEKLIASINSDPTSTWVAGYNRRFVGVSRRNAYRLVSKEMPERLPSWNKVYASGDVKLPAAYDTREAYPQCVKPVLDQGRCGSCWAFGASQSLGNRFCIQSNGTVNVQLSPQALISCDYWFQYACDGGLLQPAWWWLEYNGLPSISCWPYQSSNGYVPDCRSTCMDGQPYKTYKAKWGTTSTYIGEQAIKEAIYKGGPVEAGFAVFDDFYSYTKGVYVRKSWNFVGFHAVKMVGWGHDNETNVDYWIIENSWGPNWGEKGYFRILRGQNECLIETNVVGADPEL